LQRLVDLVARLRAPDGCPWDREQEIVDLRAYLLEEAHEAAAAIDTGDPDELLTELGDVLFEVAFIGRIAEEREWFSMDQVVDRIESKMIERHPHVFGDGKLETAEDVQRSWAEAKARDPKRSGSLLSGVAPSLPALVAALRLTQKAAGVGFDWPDTEGVLGKLEEELAEVREALAAGNPAASPEGPTAPASAASDQTPTPPAAQQSAVAGEIGDLLFSVANLARHLGIDPEAALAATNLKFRQRFEHIELRVAESGKTLDRTELDEMERYWLEAKEEA
jgi:MazG family protein